MEVRQFDIWIANLNPRKGTESGKTRPVLIVQSDLLNESDHPSSIVCPITTKIVSESNVLRIHLSEGMCDLEYDCDVMIDQIRAIDNKRLKKRMGELPDELRKYVKRSLSVILDLP
jgi:mRNA interferase MazF